MRKKMMRTLITIVFICTLSGCSDIDGTSGQTTEETVKMEKEESSILNESIESKEEIFEDTVEGYNVQKVNTVMYSITSLNIRSIPSKDGQKLGGYAKNDAVTVTGEVENGWYRVDYNGATGYVSGKYLTDEKSTEQVVKVDKSSTISTKASEESNPPKEVVQATPKPTVAPTPQPTVAPTPKPEEKTPQSTKTPSSGGGDGVTVPKKEDTEGNLVWVPTNGGTKYHKNSSCSKMKDPMQVTREHAEANGYTACGRCY